jgi:hypothetical protein
MSFGGSNSRSSAKNPALIPPPNTPTSADSSVLYAGLAGNQPSTSPALSTNFILPPSTALARNPKLYARSTLG